MKRNVGFLGGFLEGLDQRNGWEIAIGEISTPPTFFFVFFFSPKMAIQILAKWEIKITVFFFLHLQNCCES